MSWSDGNKRQSWFSFSRAARSAATAAAGAVLRPTGSSTIASSLVRDLLGLLGHEETLVIIGEDGDGAEQRIAQTPKRLLK